MTGEEPTPAQRRRQRERAAARETILSAALDVARRDGWDAVTMRRLAEEIDYSANFAYRYFTGRDDILLALKRLVESGVDACLCLVGDGPDREATEQLAHDIGIVERCLFLG